MGHKEAKLTSISLADHSSSSRADIEVEQLDSGVREVDPVFFGPEGELSDFHGSKESWPASRPSTVLQTRPAH